MRNLIYTPGKGIEGLGCGQKCGGPCEFGPMMKGDKW